VKAIVMRRILYHTTAIIGWIDTEPTASIIELFRCSRKNASQEPEPQAHTPPEMTMEVVARPSSVIYQLSSQFVSLSRVRLSVWRDGEKEALREQNLLLVTGQPTPKSHHSAPVGKPILEIGPSLRKQQMG
jgi:hypothetical protein